MFDRESQSKGLGRDLSPVPSGEMDAILMYRVHVCGGGLEGKKSDVEGNVSSEDHVMNGTDIYLLT